MAKKKAAQRPAAAKKKTAQPDTLKGWAQIAKFLGLTAATAQHWAKEGMPIRKEGRYTVADRAQLEAWLGRQSHMPKPAHVMTGDADIAEALRESISAVRKDKR